MPRTSMSGMQPSSFREEGYVVVSALEWQSVIKHISNRKLYLESI
jgi:hypothetical protein